MPLLMSFSPFCFFICVSSSEHSGRLSLLWYFAPKTACKLQCFHFFLKDIILKKCIWSPATMTKEYGYLLLHLTSLDNTTVDVNLKSEGYIFHHLMQNLMNKWERTVGSRCVYDVCMVESCPEDRCVRCVPKRLSKKTVAPDTTFRR